MDDILLLAALALGLMAVIKHRDATQQAAAKAAAKPSVDPSLLPTVIKYGTQTITLPAPSYFRLQPVGEVFG